MRRDRWNSCRSAPPSARGRPTPSSTSARTRSACVVYDELGRAPFPRFNEKSLCRLGDGLAETGELAADGFRRTVEAARRFRAIADAMGVARIDALATEATRRASNGDAWWPRSPTRPASRCASSAAARRPTTPRSASFPASSARAAWSATWAAAASRSPRSWTTGSASARSACRSAPCRWRRCSMPGNAATAKARSTPCWRERLPRRRSEPVFYAVGGGWRALAKAHMAEAGAPVRSCTATRSRPARRAPSPSSSGTCSTAKLGASFAGVPPRRLPDPAGGRAGDGPRAQAAGAGARRLLGARRARGLALRAIAGRGALSRSAGRGRAGVRPAAGPRARIRAGAGALDRPSRHRAKPRPTGACASPSARSRTSPGATTAMSRPSKASVACCSSRSSASTMPSGSSSRRRSTPAMPATSTIRGCPRPSVCCPSRGRRRAQILGRALLLGYRLSGGVPEILDALAIADRRRSRPPRSRQEGARARQRGGGGPPQAPGERPRRPPHGSGRGELEHDGRRFSRRSTSCHTGESRYP